MKDKPKWKDPSTHDKETAILRELRVGVMSAQLANKVGSDWTEVDLLLAELARRGEFRCTNKLWYRTDLEPKLRPPPCASAKRRIRALPQEAGAAVLRSE